jgi:hypothetical protein
VLPEVVADLVAGRVVVMLGGDQQLLDADGHAVAVAHRHLRLAVRAQVGQRAGVTDVGQLLGEPVRERDRQRHELRGLVRRVAEHHPLIARSRDVELVVVGGIGLRLVGMVDTHGDVGRLLVDRVEHRAGVRREPEIGVDVADRADRVPRHRLDVDVRLGRDLSRDHDEPRVDKRLARHPRKRVIGEARVQHPVGNLISDLVRMALRHRLRGKQVLVLGKVGHRRKATGPRFVWPCAR